MRAGYTVGSGNTACCGRPLERTLLAVTAFPFNLALKDESLASNTLNGLWSLLQFYSIVGIII